MEQEPKIEIHQHQNKTWYNLAEGFDKWRVFPRLLITLYGYAFYKTTEWFMTLPDPTALNQHLFLSLWVQVQLGLACMLAVHLKDNDRSKSQ